MAPFSDGGADMEEVYGLSEEQKSAPTLREDQRRGARGPLAPGEEAELWHRARIEGNERARERLIVAYRPLVFWLAKSFQIPSSSRQDLIQEGMVALVQAVDRFEPERHLRFTTYAFYRIKGRMVNFIQRSESKAPIPVEEVELLSREPAELFGQDGFDTLFALSECMDRLPEREGQIVQELFIGGKAARDVAEEWGIDVSHVHRLKRSGLSRLREWMLREER